MTRRYRLPLFAQAISLNTGVRKEAASDGWFYPVNSAEESALRDAGCELDDTDDLDQPPRPSFVMGSDNSLAGVLGKFGDVVPFGGGNQSILVIGGDHPYEQWWGTNGRDGMFQMYQDLNIRPYIAINADENTVDLTSGRGGTLGKTSTGMMSIDKARQLEQRGAEFVSHGARHNHYWDLVNTGIRVWYTGAEATPTVNITSTTLTLNTATAGATAFTLASYATLSALRTAIRAVSGWNCELATELTGNENPVTLVPLRAARSVATIGAGDPTDSNQRFALSAGLYIRYTGNVYRDVSLTVNSGSNFLLMFLDGARQASVSTNATLAAVAAAINSLNITGLTALVMDNGYSAQTVNGSTVLNPGQKQRETYCFGDEDASVLSRIDNVRSVSGYGIWLSAGMGPTYALRRSVMAVKERAASLYGVSVRAFAQSGGRMPSYQLNSVLDEHIQWRANRSISSDRLQTGSPHALPMHLLPRFTGHFTARSPDSEVPYGEEDVKAVFDAMADSPGFIVNMLNHMVTPTPSDPSGYTGLDVHSAPFYASNADQLEGPFSRELKHLAKLRNARLLDVLPPTEAERARATRRAPDNFVFNPKFRNGRQGVLTDIDTSLKGAGGIAVPGWSLDVPAANFSSVTVDSDRALRLVTNGAVTSGKVPASCHLFLEPGKTYILGATLDLTEWEASSSASWVLYPTNNPLGEPTEFSASSIASSTFRGGPSGYHDAFFRLSIPAVKAGLMAQVITQAGPFSFTSGDAIRLRIDGRAQSDPIVLTGLTSARQVAAAINTAMTTDSVYGLLGQYVNIAKVENNRVVVTAPAYSGADDLSYMEVANSTGTPLVTLFGTGVTAVRTASKLHEAVTTAVFGYRLALVLGSSSGTSVARMIAPYCRELRG